MKGPDKDKLVALYKQLSSFDKDKPAPLPQAFCVTDVGPCASPVRIPKKKDEEIAPGFLTIFDEKPASIRSASAAFERPADRAGALADAAGESADHAGLGQSRLAISLRTRARDHLERFWKARRKTIAPGAARLAGSLVCRASGRVSSNCIGSFCFSSTYQQGTANADGSRARLDDPENRLLWRANTRRLDAEQIRDAILATTGELDLTFGGPGRRSGRAAPHHLHQGGSQHPRSASGCFRRRGRICERGAAQCHHNADAIVVHDEQPLVAAACAGLRESASSGWLDG